MADTIDSAGRVLGVLDLLFRADFVHGLSPGEIGRDARLSPSAVTRYVATLEAAGAIERIPETGRIRPSVRWAQHATGVMYAVQASQRRLDETLTRLTTPTQ
jgi:DNA-binding IclR family transcriptional regulator